MGKIHIILVLALMMAYGGLVRTVLKQWKVEIPYTVVLLVSGMLLGYFSKSFCSLLNSYTAVARLSAKIYLLCFLPVLIFESAFSIRPHVFLHSSVQILLVAFVGMLVSTFFTAILVQFLLSQYKWSFLEASLFGSIISATDPVAVVAILRDVGASEVLSVLVEGESLLNDGIAVLLFEIFEEIITCEVNDNFGVFIIAKFCRITLGGPVFGYVMGKFTVFFLSIVHNDAPVETTIILASAYVVYYIGEEVLGVSGIMAVVVLGINVAYGKVYLSRNLEQFIVEFWEVAGYIANTVLFQIVGIILTETAFNDVTSKDWLYLLILYGIVHAARVLMLAIMYPLVSRFGYGLHWKDVIVMAWGGLRGAVGLCLALEIFGNKKLCGTNLGSKFLFQMSGLIVLTMTINASTTKLLLKYLNLAKLPSNKVFNIREACKQLKRVREQTLNSLKTDVYSRGADWMYVARITSMEAWSNEHHGSSRSWRNSVAVSTVEQGRTPKHCALESQELKETARLSILQAFRISFHIQFREGLLTEETLLCLLDVIASSENQPFHLLKVEDLKNLWKENSLFLYVKKICLVCTTAVTGTGNPSERNRFRQYCQRCTSGVGYECFMFLISLCHSVPSLWEWSLLVVHRNNELQSKFFVCNLVFLGIYIIEAVVKLIGFGPHNYFCVKFLNLVDLVIIVFLIIDVILYLLGTYFNSIYVIAKLIPPVLALAARGMLRWLDNRGRCRIFLGYQIGRGFVLASNRVIELLPRIICRVKLIPKLIRILENERGKILEELEHIYKEDPQVVQAAKTHEICNRILYQMHQSLEEIKDEGLLDSQELELLLDELDSCRNQLRRKKITSFKPSSDPFVISGESHRRFHVLSNAFRVFHIS